MKMGVGFPSMASLIYTNNRGRMAAHMRWTRCQPDRCGERSLPLLRAFELIVMGSFAVSRYRFLQTKPRVTGF